MGKGGSRRTQSLIEQPKSRRLAKTFFPKVQSPKILINILDCLYPHEIIALQYSNTYIFEFLSDDMIWMRLIATNKRMYLCTPSHVIFFYPEAENPMIKMPLKTATPLSRQYTSVESIEHKIYFVGGYNEVEDKRIPTGDVYEFLERKARVIKRERMTEERYNCHTAIRQNEIFVMGGENGKESLLNCEKYIISDNIWISISFLISPIRKGLVYAMGEFIYHVEPDTKGNLSLYTYSCADNLWDVKSVLLPSTLTLNSLNFCEAGETATELILFGDMSAFKLNVQESKIEYKPELANYSGALEIADCSHIKLKGTIYAMSERHFIAKGTTTPPNIAFHYTFENVTAILRYKLGSAIQ